MKLPKIFPSSAARAERKGAPARCSTDEKENIMSEPRSTHDPRDPRDPRAPNDPLAPHSRTHEPYRTGTSSGMPTWGWAAIVAVVLLLAAVFLWPTTGTQQADVDTTPPAATTPTTPPPAVSPPAASPPAQETPPAQQPPAQQ
jgi:hypothetical protein